MQLMNNIHLERVSAVGFDWRADEVVGALRELRNRSLSNRNRLTRPPVLPSRKVLSRIVDGLSEVLFPNRLSSRKVTRECIDYFVGEMLDACCRDLAEQALLEQQISSDASDKREQLIEQAVSRVRRFAAKLPDIRRLLDTDLEAAYHADPAARSPDEVLVCYPGIFALIHHRIAHELYLEGLVLIARMISEIAHSKTGIDIHPGASIGEAMFIDHGTGIVIGETAIIGNRVRMYHGVTLGAKTGDFGATQVPREIFHLVGRHPIVEDDVTIYSGAVLLGKITIGKGAIVGGNVWVTQDVPMGCRVTQATVTTESFLEGGGI